MLIEPGLVREAGIVHARSPPALALPLRLLISAQVTHGPAAQDTPHLGAFPGLGSFIVPGARVLAERPPHADPVTGRCRDSKPAAAGAQSA